MNLRKKFAQWIYPNDKDAFNRAFLSAVNGITAKYDDNDRTYLEKGYNINGDVYSIIKQMSDKCSDVPFYIKKIKDEKSLSSYKRLRKSQSFNHIVKKAELRYKAMDGEELPMPLERPNVHQTWSEFIALSVVFYNITGNIFWYHATPMERQGADPLAIYVLPSHLMEIVIKKNADLESDENPIDYYMLREGPQYTQFPLDRVIHIKTPNPNYDFNGSHLYGMSPLKAVLDNIQSSNEASTNNIKILKNGGAFGFIHSKGQNVMTSDQAQSVKERLVEMDLDSGRLGKIAGVSAEVGFTRIALTTEELKPFEYLNYDQKQIANALGWSIELLNSREGSTGINNGTMDTELKRVLTNTCMPLLRKIEQAINSEFLPLFPKYKNSFLEFDHTEMPEMQPDMEKLTKWLYEGLDRGIFTRLQVLEALRFPIDEEDPDMMVRTVTTQTIPLSDALVPLDPEQSLTIDQEE